MTALSERQIRWLAGLIGVGSFVALLTLEISTETEAVTTGEFLSDSLSLLLTITSAVGVGVLVQRMQVEHEEKMNLIRDLEIARAEGENWRSKVRPTLDGVKVEIDKQFQQWGMTAAERDVGLLILKGLSHKEIAAFRSTTEVTVRQQAQSIYRKSDLPGKTAFSAYFLDDLFAAQPPAGNSGHSRPDGNSVGSGTQTAAPDPPAASQSK